MFDLAGRVVVISGANAGIGLGFARGVARAGGDVVIWGRRADKNEEAAKELSGFGVRVLARQVDVSIPEQIASGMRDVVEEMGRVNGVIANAGLMHNFGNVMEITTEEWRTLLAVNLDGVFHVAREGARQMKRQYDAGDRSGGSLLLVGSLASTTGTAGSQHYNASKGALIPMARGIALEAGRYGIRCNVVCPGHTVSETADLPRDHPVVRHVQQYSPMQRFGTPADFEGIGVYFMSDVSRHHTGDVVTIDGGWMANAGKSNVGSLAEWP
jgi:NAD(P)-dependent dehydrogenase (short-subunit alcohol dehydrogenase family)